MIKTDTSRRALAKCHRSLVATAERGSLVQLASVGRGFLTRHALGTLWGQVFIPVSNLLCAILAVRVLSESDGNTFFLLSSLALVASALSDFGQRNTVYTDVSQLQGESLRKYVASVYRLRCVFGVAVFSGVAVVAFGMGAGTPGTIALFGIMAANMYVADPGTKILCGKSLSQLELPLSTLDRGTVLAGLLAMYVYGSGSLSLVLSIFVIAGVLRFVIAAMFVRYLVLAPESNRLITPLSSSLRTNEPAIDPHSSFVWNHFWAGLVTLGTLLHLRLPVLILPLVYLEEHVAHISILLMVCQSFLLVPSIVARVLFPQMLRRQTAASARPNLLSRRVLFGSVGICLAMGLFAGLVMHVFASPLLGIVHPSYVGTPGLLQLASYSIPLLCMAQIVRLIVTSAGLARSLLVPLAVGMGTGLMAMIVLSPVLGPAGIIYGYLISELTTLAMSLTVALRLTSRITTG